MIFFQITAKGKKHIVKKEHWQKNREVEEEIYSNSFKKRKIERTALLNKTDSFKKGGDMLNKTDIFRLLKEEYIDKIHRIKEKDILDFMNENYI